MSDNLHQLRRYVDQIATDITLLRLRYYDIIMVYLGPFVMLNPTCTFFRTPGRKIHEKGGRGRRGQKLASYNEQEYTLIVRNLGWA